MVEHSFGDFPDGNAITVPTESPEQINNMIRSPGIFLEIIQDLQLIHIVIEMLQDNRCAIGQSGALYCRRSRQPAAQ